MQINFDGRKIELDDDAYTQLVDATHEIMGLEEGEGLSFRPDYSGRGMYESTCIGVVGQMGSEIAFAFALVKVFTDWRMMTEGMITDFDDITAFLVMNMRQDNMGRDMIYYWPGVRLI